jgi:hypothetical protein
MRFDVLLRYTLTCCLLVLWGSEGKAQERKIGEWSEKAQKQFMEEYLALWVEGVKLVDAGLTNDAMRLLGMHSWAVDLYVERIKAIRKEPDGGMNRATALIARLYHSGRPDVLEIVSDRLQDDPEFPDLVKSLLVSSIGSPHPGEFNVWTRALQSNHPTVRKTMQEFVVAVCTSGHGPQWDLIVAGIVDRYGHSPNALEMASDPVFQAIAAGDARRAAEVKSRLLSSTEKEHLRRQVAPSVVRK